MSYLLPELCDEYNVVRTKNDPHTTCDRAMEGVCTLTLVFVSILPTRMVLSFSSWFGLYEFIRVWGHVSAHVSSGFDSHLHIRHSNVLWLVVPNHSFYFLCLAHYRKTRLLAKRTKLCTRRLSHREPSSRKDLCPARRPCNKPRQGLRFETASLPKVLPFIVSVSV